MYMYMYVYMYVYMYMSFGIICSVFIWICMSFQNSGNYHLFKYNNDNYHIYTGKIKI